MATRTASFPTWPIPQSARLRRNAPLLIVYGLIIALVVFGWANSERFLTDRNLLNILRQTAFLGTLAIGQTFVILLGGIDLSVGSLVKLSMLVAAIIMNGSSDNTLMAILATLGLGVLVGAVHALAITRLNIAPFIVTLGTYSILRGIAFNITTTPIGRASPEVVTFYDQRIGPVYTLIVVFLALLLAAIFILRRTPFGRYVYAIGGNEQVARLSGIPVNRVKFGVYILCSLLASLTGIFLLSRSGVGDPVIGDGLELQAITAVILGGTSLFGGRGSMIGTLGGVLLLGLTGNLLVVLNANQWIRDLIQGAVILIAVALYKQKERQ
jgi:ribose/xylose/arabinose/galactoside ABC-type transport system permease subunit